MEAAKEAAEREREESLRQAAAAAEREKNKSKWSLMRNEMQKRKMRKMAKLLLPKPVAGKDVATKVATKRGASPNHEPASPTIARSFRVRSVSRRLRPQRPDGGSLDPGPEYR